MINELFLSLSGFGYFGVFLISLIGSLTIIFPLPAAAFVFSAAGFLNPFLLGLIAGLGATLGEFAGYALGFSTRKVGEKFKKDFERAEKMFDKYGGFLALALFAATPLPDDIVGVVAGFLKYDKKRFFVAVLLGKIVFHEIVAFAGFFGINLILQYFF